MRARPLAVLFLLLFVSVHGARAQSGPSISGLSQPLGAAGQPITISGSGFGAAQGSSFVTFGSATASVSSWSDTSVTAAVPASLAAGNVNIVVTVNGTPSNSASFLVIPVITGLSTYSASPGTQVTISGSGFDVTQGGSTIDFNGIPGSPTSWSNSSIVTSVPAGAFTGPLTVTVNSIATNSVNFTVPTPPPTISSISPGVAPIGASITITGTNFGDTQGSSRVLFRGQQGSPASSPTSWSATSITVPVPTGALTGSISVMVNGQVSNFVRFVVANLNISSISPSAGGPATVVTISGSGFGSTQGTSFVTFNGAAAAVSSWNDAQIVVTVPTNATTGNVVVTENNTPSNGVPFTVGTPPTITATISPTPNASGWNNSNVTVTFACTPGTFAIATCPSPQVITTEGPNQSVSGTATDTAGLTASTSVTLNIDKTQPLITIASPSDGASFSISAVTVTGSASDSLSGLSSVTCNGAAASVTSGNFSCNISLALGVNLIAVRATDIAGNVASSNFHVTLSGALPPPHALQITPATVNLSVGQTQTFNVIDEAGRVRTDATWTISDTTLATISADSSPLLAAIAAGQVTLTASVQALSVQLQLNIGAGGIALAPGTVLWSAPAPPPDSEVMQIVNAVPSRNGPDLYSIEWNINSDTNPLQTTVRALTSDGRQLWTTTLPGGGFQPGLADSNGGLLLELTVGPPFTVRHLIDLDPQTGAQVWEHDRTLGDQTPLAPNVTVASNGAIFLPDDTLDAATGTRISTVLDSVSVPNTTALVTMSCTGFTEYSQSNPRIVTPPSIGADGTLFALTSEFHVVYTDACDGNGPTLTQYDLKSYVVRADTNGAVSITPYFTVTSASIMPGGNTTIILPSGKQLIVHGHGPLGAPFRPVPDGQGGAFLPWWLQQQGGSGFQSHLTHLDSSGNLSDVLLSLPAASNFEMVLGENNLAFATNTTNVIAFDTTSGQTSWSYTGSFQGVDLLAATENAGVAINDSQLGVASFDANGNRSQIISASGSALPSYSWNGAWAGISTVTGALSNVVLPILPSFTSLWATPLGNPSGQNAAGRPWFFILNWQNAFDFIPDNPSMRPDLKTDITIDATAIKTAALTALKQAYKQWPVTVVEGTPNTGDHQAVVQTTSTDQSTSCGSTNINVALPVDSEVWYECNMKEAQTALGVVINNSADEAQALARQDLIQAIGRGIGNNAAHEIAHQFLIKCCSMDVLTADDPAAAATYNNGDADGSPNPEVINSDPAPYTGFGKDRKTAIHWESTTQKALTSCLSKGYIKYTTACVVQLQLSQSSPFASIPGSVLAKAVRKQPNASTIRKTFNLAPQLTKTNQQVPRQ